MNLYEPLISSVTIKLHVHEINEFSQQEICPHAATSSSAYNIF